MNILRATSDEIGQTMLRMVREAIRIIQQERVDFSSEWKPAYNGGDDIVTSADQKSQAMYVREIERYFPGVGIVAEENYRTLDLTTCGAYFTIDPLDGTKAFARGQSYGVATMIALVMDGVVVAAFIGDVNTGEIFGYQPDDECVWHYLSEECRKKLKREHRPEPLERQFALLRVTKRPYHGVVNRLVHGPDLFAGTESMSGSIGISLSRVWKREVILHALPRAMRPTPWDNTPLVGISEMLNMAWLRPCETGLERYEPRLPLEPLPPQHDTIVVHDGYADQLIRLTSAA